MFGLWARKACGHPPSQVAATAIQPGPQLQESALDGAIAVQALEAGGPAAQQPKRSQLGGGHGGGRVSNGAEGAEEEMQRVERKREMQERMEAAGREAAEGVEGKVTDQA